MSNFLNDFLNKAKNVTDAAGRNTDRLYQLSKLKITYLQVNGEIKSKYEALGARVYDMYKTGEENTEELLAMTAELDTLYAKLEQLQARIDALDKYLSCPNCGTRSKLSATYCNHCGTRLTVTDDQPGETDEYSPLMDIEE
jgi:ribosomal protein L40E